MGDHERETKYSLQSVCNRLKCSKVSATTVGLLKYQSVVSTRTLRHLNYVSSANWERVSNRPLRPLPHRPHRPSPHSPFHLPYQNTHRLGTTSPSSMGQGRTTPTGSSVPDLSSQPEVFGELSTDLILSPMPPQTRQTMPNGWQRTARHGSK